MTDVARSAAAAPDLSPAAPITTTTALSTMLPPKMTAVSMNLLDLIKLDHNKLRALYDAYRLPTATNEQKQMLAWEMICEVSTHAAKEEMVLYPAVRRVLGDAIADKCLQDHLGVKNSTAQLDAMTIIETGFETLVTDVVQATLDHIDDEENRVLPALAAGLTEDSLLQLGIQFEASKARAPTRPHPQAPNVPPFNEAANAAAATLDMTADQARLPSVTPIFAPPAEVGQTTQ